MRTAQHVTLLCVHLLYTAVCRSESIPSPDVLWIAHERSDSLDCWRNLQEIGFAARTWQSEHGEMFPSGFSALTNELGSPSVLYCPSNYRREPAPENWNGFTWSSIDYEWVTPSNQTDAVFCRCKIHRNVARVDGSSDSIFGFNPGWPRILAPPLTHYASTGCAVRFECVLTNVTAPISFQWNREDPFWRTNVVFVATNEETGEGYWRTNFIGTNAPIAGATNAVFVIASATTNDSGWYSVSISNALGVAKTSLHRLVVPIPLTPRPLAETFCISRLRSIHLAAQLWAADHTDNLPLNFAVMTNDIGYPLFGWPTLLFCPADTNRVAPTNWTGVDFSNTSYEILQTDPMPQSYSEPFARCRVHGFVVLGDGTVQPALNILAGSPARTNGHFQFIIQNPAGRTFEIQASTNLIDWTILAAVTDGSVTNSFIEPATNFIRRFYRARLLP